MVPEHLTLRLLKRNGICLSAFASTHLNRRGLTTWTTRGHLPQTYDLQCSQTSFSGRGGLGPALVFFAGGWC